MTVYLSPISNDQVVDSNGAPLVGGWWRVYLAGTTTPVTTYTDSTGGTPQPTDIVLDAAGRPANPIWLSGGIPVKFRLYSAAAVILLTVDDVSGINDPAGITAQDQWVLYGAAPTYISGTSFSLVGDQTGTFQIGRRVKTTNTGGTVYSSITNSVFGAVTTVTVTNDSGSLDSGLSAVSYGLISAVNTSAPSTLARSGANSDITSTSALASMTGLQTLATVQRQTWATRADVASATTTVLTSATDDIRITGTTAITAFTIAVGRLVRVTAGGAFTLTNNAAIVTQTGGNIVCQSGDTFMLRATAADTVEVLLYTPSILAQQTTRSMVRLDTQNGYGATNTRIPRFTTTRTNQGTDITYADSATLGALFTINVAGVYAISFTHSAGGSEGFCVTLNESAGTLSSSAASVAQAEILTFADVPTASASGVAQWTGYLANGSVIRPHASGGTPIAPRCMITIVRLA